MTYSLTFACRRRWAVLLSAGLVFSGFCRAVWADPAGPSPADHNVAVIVTSALPHEHLLRHPLDTEISQRCFKTFLRDLDPMKMYFYQSDIDDFAQVPRPAGRGGPAGRHRLRLHWCFTRFWPALTSG